MKLARLFGTVLVAVFAISALFVSAAFAGDPEFTMLPSVKTFTGVSGLGVLRSATNNVDCLSDENTGEITTMDEVGNIVVIFHGCKEYTHAGVFCSTIKSTNETTEGLIKTNTLRGLLGLIDPGKAAGLLLEPVKGIFLDLAEESGCATPETAVEGSVAGAYSPTGVLQRTGLLTFEPSTAGGNKQTIKEILVLGGLVKPKLSSFVIAESSEETDDTITYAENVEVN